MTITINGEPRVLERELTVGQLIETIGLNADVVAVERNRSIVKREAFETVRLADGDQLEIVEFVGGG